MPNASAPRGLIPCGRCLRPAKLKQWRRGATRHDKLAANFLGFIKLASIMLWLKRKTAIF